MEILVVFPNVILCCLKASSLSDISRPTELIVRLTSGSQN